MREEIQITCITRVPHDNPHEGITHLGRGRHRWPRERVIEWIEAGTYNFAYELNGRWTDVAVIDGPNGKYLRGYTTGQGLNDNLLDLPECPLNDSASEAAGLPTI